MYLFLKASKSVVNEPVAQTIYPVTMGTTMPVTLITTKHQGPLFVQQTMGLGARLLTVHNIEASEVIKPM